MEISFERLWILNEKGTPLLGNLYSSSILAVNLSITSDVRSAQMAYCKTRFCIGISLIYHRKTFYMDIPKWFVMSKGNIKDHDLKIHCNIYGQK